LHLLHYCNSFLGGQLLHIAIFNRFFDLYCYCYCNSSEHYCQCLDHNLRKKIYSAYSLWSLNIRVMKVLKTLEYHHWHSLKSKLDYQWPTCPKRTGKEFEKQDLQSSKVFPSAQGKMGWNGQPFSGFHTSKKANDFKLSYVWEVPWESNLRGEGGFRDFKGALGRPPKMA